MKKTELIKALEFEEKRFWAIAKLEGTSDKRVAAMCISHVIDALERLEIENQTREMTGA